MSYKVTKLDGTDYPAFEKAAKHILWAGHITAIGDLTILNRDYLALFSSSKCPGTVILKTYDFIRKLREEGTAVIGGFHSAIEQECLNLLLKGQQPIILCPARNIMNMKIRPEYRIPIESGRLLILSPFDTKQKRISTESSLKRNEFVAALASTIFIPYAAPGSKTEMACKEWIERGKVVKTFDTAHNRNLLGMGAESI